MPLYGANIPGGDFFDHVLGTSTDMLTSIVGSLPSFQDLSVPLPSYQDGYEVDPFLGLPNIGTSITGGSDPFADALQDSIMAGRRGNGAPARGVTAENPKSQAASPAAHGQNAAGSYATANVPPSGDYVDYARKVAQAYGVDPDIFVRQINQESKFNPSARSPAGAAGIAQFMPGTAAQYGVNVNDPYSSLDGAARHMRDLYKKYGRWDLALAAYNAGPGNVDKYGGVPPFAETQTYIRNILGQ